MRVANITIEDKPDFADLPDGQRVDRDAKQQRVRAVLTTYCTTQAKHDGMTAWEVAGKVLAVLPRIGVSQDWR